MAELQHENIELKSFLENEKSRAATSKTNLIEAVSLLIETFEKENTVSLETAVENQNQVISKTVQQLSDTVNQMNSSHNSSLDRQELFNSEFSASSLSLVQQANVKAAAILTQVDDMNEPCQEMQKAADAKFTEHMDGSANRISSLTDICEQGITFIF